MNRLALCLLAVLLAAPRAPAADETVQVAVLRFLPRGDAGEQAWISTALADLVAGALAARPGIVPVERERVADLLREMDLMEKGIVDRAGACRFALVAAADRAVLGTFAVAEGRVSAEASLLDARTGEALSGAKAEGALDDLPDVAARLAAGLLGGGAPAPGMPQPDGTAARVPVEALAEFYRGASAEERGDYPRAFVHLARASRSREALPRAALALGRLYAAMGESRHAVEEWRRLAAERGGEIAYEVLLLAVRTLDYEADDPGAATAVCEEIARAFPDRPDAWRHTIRAARLRERAGDVAGALDLLAREEAATRDRIGRIRETATPREIARRHYGRLEDLNAAVWYVQLTRREIAIRAYLRGEPPEPLPPGLLLLDPEAPVVSIRDRPGRTTLLAPRGRRIHSVRIVGEKRAPVFIGPEGRIATCTRWSRRPGAAPGPAEAEVELIDADDHAAPHRPAGARLVADGIEGVAQHARISRDPAGTVHAVWASGPSIWAMFREGVSVAGLDRVDCDLWIASSSDAGGTWTPPRRLRVSTDRHEIYPFLLHGRDGVHRLVWTSDRGNPGFFRVWYAESDDLIRWSYPRLVPLPFISAVSMGGRSGHAHVASAPSLVEGRTGVFHLVLTLFRPEEGSGLYALRTTDGITWSEPVRIAEGERIAEATPLAGGALLVASRAREGPTLLHRSADGVRWRTEVFSPPETASEPHPLFPPMLLETGDGRLLAIEETADRHPPLSVSGIDRIPDRHRALFELGDDGTWRGPLTEIDGLVGGGLVEVAGQRLLTTFSPVFDFSGRPGSLYVVPVEVPE